MDVWLWCVGAMVYRCKCIGAMVYRCKCIGAMVYRCKCIGAMVYRCNSVQVHWDLMDFHIFASFGCGFQWIVTHISSSVISFLIHSLKISTS